VSGEERLRLMVVIASTRPGRIGLPVGEWIVGQAEAHGGFDVDLADLAEIALPFMDEPNHPRLKHYTQPHTWAWSERVDSADAFVFVFPEYNHGLNAPLKNALDFLYQEWAHKPAGLVTYGGIAAGSRSAEMLRLVLLGLRVVPVFDSVYIPFVAQALDDGAFQAPESIERAAATMFDEVERYARALRGLREPRPEAGA
jgi:NAD(P)H-dependent FMN reductase